jgi:RecJ OB domain/DHHA1 domain
MTVSLSQLLQKQPDLYQKVVSLGIQDELQDLLNRMDGGEGNSAEWQKEFRNIISKTQQVSGSLRAPEGYNLPKVMSNFSDDLNKFGGHPQAAGFSFDLEKLDQIRANFDLYTAKEEGLSEQKIYVPENVYNLLSNEMKIISAQKNCLYVNGQQLDKGLLSEIMRLEPFGQDFPQPLLFLELGTGQVKSFRVMGQDKKHLKLTTSMDIYITIFNVTAEITDPFYHFINSRVGKVFVACRLSQNTWNGVTNLELIGQEVCFHF